ncbi:MAG: glycosyltransferase family 4 protein [Polyangiaceae bacterium]
MPRTRVGIFTADFAPALGGIGVVTYDLYSGLANDAEFEPIVFSPAINTLANHHRLLAIHSRLWLPLSFSLTVNALLERLIRQHDLDLVHFMGSSGGVQLFRKPSKPAFLTLHNTYHYLFRQRPGLVFRGMREAERASLRNSDRIATVSYGVLNELPVSEGPGVEVIQNGIDISLYYPRPMSRERHFLFLGRLTLRKGVLDLVEAFAHANLPGYELHFAGDGPADEILATAERLGVAARVRILGRVPREATPELLSKAHAVVLPSWSEGFPLIVTEAMACGALFIGTKIPGIIEQVQEGVTGMLCPMQDPAALARCLTESVTLDAERVTEIRQAAAKAGRERSKERMVEKYRDSYRAVLLP